MLKVNKKTMNEVQKKLGLTNEGWAKTLGLTKSSLNAIKNYNGRTFTLQHILIAYSIL